MTKKILHTDNSGTDEVLTNDSSVYPMLPAAYEVADNEGVSPRHVARTPQPQVESTSPLSQVFNEDNMVVMKRYPDKFFDLAVVDPPYGIGENGGKFRGRIKDNYNRIVVHTKKDWDNKIPKPEYWKELFRVSKNQIVCGGNYFSAYLPPSMGWIFWDKLIGGDFSDGELIWTSFNKALRKFTYSYHKDTKGGHERIHPTQKPIALFGYCLIYAKAENNWKILDTHLGSGSSRIAAYKAGLSFTGCELDEEYFEAQEARFKKFISQGTLF